MNGGGDIAHRETVASEEAGVREPSVQHGQKIVDTAAGYVQGRRIAVGFGQAGAVHDQDMLGAIMWALSQSIQLLADANVSMSPP